MEEIFEEFGEVGAPSMYEITKLVYEAKQNDMKKEVNKELVLKSVAKIVTDAEAVRSYIKGKTSIESLTTKGIKFAKPLLSRVEEESVNYATAEHAAIDHLKMASAHLFEETEGRDIDNWLSDIEKIIQKLENRINS